MQKFAGMQVHEVLTLGIPFSLPTMLASLAVNTGNDERVYGRTGLLKSGLGEDGITALKIKVADGAGVARVEVGLNC